jgi:disulfide bond formation protein DsbB
VITATSAAALAIQATSNNIELYWLVTVFYSIAFGLSLQGLILITYMTIAAGGSSDEAIGRLALGKLVVSSEGSRGPVKPVVFVMALPAILATYSSISLLAGLVVMVVAAGDGVQNRRADYIIATMIPVCGGFLCLLMAIIFCEVGTWYETHGRAMFLKGGSYEEAESSTAQVEHLSRLTEVCKLRNHTIGAY